MTESSYDPLLVKAAERRDAARREADAWDDWIKRYLELGGEGVKGSSTPKRSAPREAGSSVIQQRPDVTESLRVVRETITAANRPVPNSDLLDEMDRHQIPIAGADRTKRINTLDSRLRYYKDFRKIPGRGWWFADQPLPPVNGLTGAAHEEQPAV